VKRPTASAHRRSGPESHGYAITGHHELLMPLVAGAWLPAGRRNAELETMSLFDDNPLKPLSRFLSQSLDTEARASYSADRSLHLWGRPISFAAAAPCKERPFFLKTYASPGRGHISLSS